MAGLERQVLAHHRRVLGGVRGKLVIVFFTQVFTYMRDGRVRSLRPFLNPRKAFVTPVENIPGLAWLVLRTILGLQE